MHGYKFTVIKIQFNGQNAIKLNFCSLMNRGLYICCEYKLLKHELFIG